MSDNITKRMQELAEEFRFYMLWNEYRPYDKCKLYIKNQKDVLLAVNKAYIDMMPRTFSGLGLTFDKEPDGFKEKHKSEIKEWIKTKEDLLKTCKDTLAGEISKEFIRCKSGNDFQHAQLCSHFIKAFSSVLKEINQKIGGVVQERTQIKNTEVLYGKAQKIVNMTCKYLMLFDDADEYVEVFKKCDMPVDSYIIAYFNNDEICGDNKKIRKAWSNFDKVGDYDPFKERIRAYCQEGKVIKALNEERTLTGFPLFDEFIIWHEGKSIYDSNNKK